jgi:hypothetical protein
MKKAVFWDVGPCRYCVNRRFGGTYRLHLQGRRQEEIRERASVSRCNRLSHSISILALFLITWAVFPNGVTRDPEVPRSERGSARKFHRNINVNLSIIILLGINFTLNDVNCAGPLDCQRNNKLTRDFCVRGKTLSRLAVRHHHITGAEPHSRIAQQ